MIEWFRKLLRIKREISPSPFQSPVFLTGCMRSGTTFLANLLTEHPNLLHLEGELLDVWTEIGGLDCKHSRAYKNRDNLKPDYINNMTSYFEKCNLEYRKPKYVLWRIINKWKKGSGGVFKDKVNLRLLNKNVHLINRLDYVLNMFPNSKVIVLIRPIESQVNSIKLHFEKMESKGIYIDAPQNEKDSWISNNDPSRKNWDISSLALKWIQLNKTCLEDLEKNSPKKYLIIEYNQLVENTASEIEKIYSFLEIGNTPINVNHSLKDRKSFNTNTGGNPLYDWKERLTNLEKESINTVIEENKIDYNYIQSFL